MGGGTVARLPDEVARAGALRPLVITDTERDVKMIMLDAHFTPSVAIVDYELTLSMPPALTAHVGLDTLTHGIEAYVSRKASLLTDALALSCVSLCALPATGGRQPQRLGSARAGMAAAASKVASLSPTAACAWCTA